MPACLPTGVSEYAISRQKDRAIVALEKGTGIQWRPNALRHSYGSYRLAVVKCIDQVALKMGNSPAKVREHYNDPKFTADGVKWFEVRPLPAEHNIITLHPTRAIQ